MKRFLAWMATVALAGGLPLAAQTAADVNEGLRLVKEESSGVYTLSCWGKEGRTYFIQQSDDMLSWSYVPEMGSGAAEVLSWGVTTTAQRLFFRLRYTDAETDGNALMADFDGDGLPNHDELAWQSDPFDADSDDDLLEDGVEVMTYHTSPMLADWDGDGLSDGAEVNVALTNPLNADSDGDTLSDGAEVNTHQTNPLSQDSDGDGLNDEVEVHTHHTNPNAVDSDGDGIMDKSEVRQGTNALSASSRPAFESVEVVGNGGPGERKTEQLTLTLPEGARSYLVVVAAKSEEFPAFTGTQSQYDDVFDWKITLTGAPAIEGNKKVNELHADWEESMAYGTSLLGLTPVAVVKMETIQGQASGTTSVQIELGAKNVRDSVLHTTVAAMVVPVEVKWEAKPEFNNLSENKSPVDYVWHIQRSIGAQDGRWMQGRGLRIFPDKETPTAQLRNKVRLKIKAGSTRTDKKVFVRVYDVDDPTPAAFDAGGQVDTNGEAGGDNIGSDEDHDDFHFISGGAVSNASVQKSGNNQQYAACDVTLDANNEATIEMQVSMQPGDNFRAAIALDPADFSTVQVTSPGGSGFLKPNNETPQGFKGGVSDMLTVWRSLNLEFDTMAAPPDMIAPDMQNVKGQAWVGGTRLVLDPSTWIAMPDSFYHNGLAETPAGFYEIENSELLGVITFKTPVPETSRNWMKTNLFKIKDDDGRGLPADYSPMLPRHLAITDRMRARFVTAYIELKDVGSLNTLTEVPFETNAVPAQFTSMDDARNVEDSEGYWNHLIIAAYQPLKEDDGDPHTEERVLGTTNTWTPMRSAIFLETIRDEHDNILNYNGNPSILAQYQAFFRRDVEGTIAHETAHAPPGDDDHAEGGLIGASIVDIDGQVFEPVTVRRFRKTLSWGGQP